MSIEINWYHCRLTYDYPIQDRVPPQWCRDFLYDVDDIANGSTVKLPDWQSHVSTLSLLHLAIFIICYVLECTNHYYLMHSSTIMDELCVEKISYCVAELLPGWATDWLQLPSAMIKIKFNCLQYLAATIILWHRSKRSHKVNTRWLTVAVNQEYKFCKTTRFQREYYVFVNKT